MRMKSFHIKMSMIIKSVIGLSNRAPDTWQLSHFGPHLGWRAAKFIILNTSSLVFDTQFLVVV